MHKFIVICSFIRSIWGLLFLLITFWLEYYTCEHQHQYFMCHISDIVYTFDVGLKAVANKRYWYRFCRFQNIHNYNIIKSFIHFYYFQRNLIIVSIKLPITVHNYDIAQFTKASKIIYVFFKALFRTFCSDRT